MRFHERFVVLYAIVLLYLLPLVMATQTEAAAAVGARGRVLELAAFIGATGAAAAARWAGMGSGAPGHRRHSLMPGTAGA